jgi:hypothetical protein
VQFALGQEVWLTNPRSHRRKVAVDSVSGIGGQQKFHGATIPESWFKIDVREALMLEVPLIFPNEVAEQDKVKDAVGSNAIWDQKYMKCAS